MTTTALLIAAVVTLPAAALGGWLWMAVRHFDRQLHSGFEGIHLDS